MGKKARSKAGQEKAKGRKLDPKERPPPPAPLESEIGSLKMLDEPTALGKSYQALDRPGYDDGGVADLTLVIDMDDSALRRKRGDANYFSALKCDLLPRVKTGQPWATLTRRDQKVRLARMLFSEEGEDDENNDASDVYVDAVDGTEDDETKARRLERLNAAKQALKISTVLRDPACASLSLTEISKRLIKCYGKEGAEAALRCANKAVEIALDGYYDGDDIAIEAEEEPKINSKYEKDATYPGLSHPTSLKYYPLRVAHLCLRTAYVHRGNALAALGREDEARESYEKVLPLVEAEPRAGRVDWERAGIYVNVGNTYSRQGNFDKADEYYDKAERLGQDHIDAENSCSADGLGIKILALRARAFALKKAGRGEEGRDHMKQVIDLQGKFQVEQKKEKDRQEMSAAEQTNPQEQAGSGAEEMDGTASDAPQANPLEVQ